VVVKHNPGYRTQNGRTNVAINAKTDGDYGYICLYNGKKCEVYAKDMSAAKDKAVAHFKVKPNKRHNVSVHLAERPDGTGVTHTPVD
jgi:IMP cyclohydrolase